MAAVALDVQLADIVLFQNSHTRFLRRDVDEDSFGADARRPWGWGFLKAWGYLILNRKTFAMCSSPKNKWQKSFCESA